MRNSPGMRNSPTPPSVMEVQSYRILVTKSIISDTRSEYFF